MTQVFIRMLVIIKRLIDTLFIDMMVVAVSQWRGAVKKVERETLDLVQEKLQMERKRERERQREKEMMQGEAVVNSCIQVPNSLLY